VCLTKTLCAALNITGHTNENTTKVRRTITGKEQKNEGKKSEHGLTNTDGTANVKIVGYPVKNVLG